MVDDEIVNSQDRLSRETANVLHDINLSPRRNRPYRRQIDQMKVALPQFRRLTLLNELRPAPEHS